MSLLTDEEIDNIEKDCWENLNTDNCISFARAIEQAVMAKLREQNPVAWEHSSGYITKDADWVFDRKEECEPLYLHPAPSAPGTGSEIASKLKLLAMNWCNEHAQPVVCGSLNQKELYALIDQVCIGVDSPPSAPEGMVLVPIEIIDRFPQLNPSNYDHEGVCYLNAWGVELELAAARSEE